MFGTFRYDKDTGNHQHVELASADGVEARGYTPIACDLCRTRKLKCSGDKDGCDRCQSASVACTYRQVSSARDINKPQRRVSYHETPSPQRASARRQSQRSRAEAGQEERFSASASSGPPSSLLSSETAVESPDIWMSSFWHSVNHNDNNDYSENHSGSHMRRLSQMPVMSPTDIIIEEGLASGRGVSSGIITPATDRTGPSPTPEQVVVNSFDSVLNNTPPLFAHNADGPSQHAAPKAKMYEPPSSASAPAPVVAATSRRSASSCPCLSTMARFLETMGAEGTGAGADMLLMCVGRGLGTCEEVLECPNCNACTDNGMLLATVVQQLGTLAGSIADRLLARSHNNGQERGAEILHAGISFGRYRIEIPDLRAQLVYNAVLLHLGRLQVILSRIRDGVRPNSVAWKLLEDSESKVVSSFNIIQQQQSSWDTAGSMLHVPA